MNEHECDLDVKVRQGEKIIYCKDIGCDFMMHLSHTPKLATLLAEQEARIASLEEALKPFSERANEFCFIQDGNKTLIEIKYLHAATSALQEKGRE